MQRQRETEEELANSKAHREKVQKQKEREEQERVEQVTIYTISHLFVHGNCVHIQLIE